MGVVVTVTVVVVVKFFPLSSPVCVCPWLGSGQYPMRRGLGALKGDNDAGISPARRYMVVMLNARVTIQHLWCILSDCSSEN